MFDIGFGEMLLLAAIALIAIGPKQLPEVARVVGRLLNEFKRATGDFTRTIVEARDSTHEMLSETQRSIHQGTAAPTTTEPQSTPPTEASVPPENQMSFNLTEGATAPNPAPPAQVEPPVAPSTDPLKKES